MNSITSRLPEELHLQSLVDIRNAHESVVTFGKLLLVSKEMYEVIEKVWSEFVRKSDLLTLLANGKQLEDPKKFTRENFKNIQLWSQLDWQKWLDGEPKIIESNFSTNSYKLEIDNSQDHALLWSTENFEELTYVDLATQEKKTLTQNSNSTLISPLTVVSFTTSAAILAQNNSLDSSGNKILINEILIVDTNNSKILSQIEIPGKILKMRGEGNYLYIMQGRQKTRTLWQYDIKNLENPKELKLPEDVNNFHITSDHLLFFNNHSKNIFNISKTNFVNGNPSFSVALLQEYWRKVQIIGNECYTFSRVFCSNKITINKLAVVDETLTMDFIHIQDLEIALDQFSYVTDYYIQLDKVYIACADSHTRIQKIW